MRLDITINSGVCEPYTIDFCGNYSTSADECLDCIDGFKFDSGKCKIIELNNCILPSSVEGQCTTCVSGFYLDTNTGTCRIRNLVGCETPTSNANTCDSCISGYKKEADNLCYQIIIENCPPANVTKDGCSDCEPGYDVNQYKTCSKNVSDLTQCSKSNSNGMCTACDDSDKYYLEPITKNCKSRNNTTNCTGFDLNADFCTTCDNTHFLLGGKCKDRTFNCKTFVDGKNECKTCNDGDYLNSYSKNCLPNILQNCKTPYPFSWIWMLSM